MQRNKIVQRMKSLPPVAYMLVVLIVIFSVMSPKDVYKRQEDAIIMWNRAI